MQPDYTYEPTSAWVERIARLPFPLGTVIFLATSPVARAVFKRVVIDKSTDSALHPIYEYGSQKPGYTVWDHRWQSSKAAQSLRFRYEWVKSVISDQITSKTKDGSPIEILSLGSGTGFAFINTLKNLQVNPDLLTVYFVDTDPRAINRAEDSITANGLEKMIHTINAKSTDALADFGENYFDLIELVGIGEYVDDEWLTKETELIYKGLKKGGAYIGANISSKDQIDFAHKVLHWPAMNYRSPQQIQAILRTQPFADIKLTTCGVFQGYIGTK